MLKNKLNPLTSTQIYNSKPNSLSSTSSLSSKTLRHLHYKILLIQKRWAQMFPNKDSLNWTLRPTWNFKKLSCQKPNFYKETATKMWSSTKNCTNQAIKREPWWVWCKTWGWRFWRIRKKRQKYPRTWESWWTRLKKWMQA